VVSCAKTAEPIEMQFGLWAWMGPRNHVLDGSPEVLRDVVWQPIWEAICHNWLYGLLWPLMGHNVGCMIAIDTLCDF